VTILIDEFYGTDPYPGELVKFLTGLNEGVASNVFLVGGKKQGI
jgi:ATP-dependent exoDNAse (exonuclease V) beta subunit